MGTRKLKRGVSNWVDGDKFWGREKEIELFTEYLADGAHILLTAQRRIGKTSLMREVSRRISGDYYCLHVDFEGSETPADAIVELAVETIKHRRLRDKVRDVFSSFLNKIDTIGIKEFKITLRGGVGKGDWQIKGDRVFAALAEADKPVVLFFDEVPILVNRILKDDDYEITPERKHEADLFMSWIRDNSQQYRGKIMIVLTGSIGLEPVLRQAGLSATINHFQPFELNPWNQEEAVGALQALANECGIRFEEGVCEYMADALGCCIPHHVQMYFEYVYQTCKKKESTTCTRDIAEHVYNESMLSTRGHVELSHLEERLKQVLGKEILPLAIDLLTEAAVVGKLTAKAIHILCEEHKERFSNQDEQEVLREVLGVLEHDGYLKEGTGGYQFVSKLLRDWWSKRFGGFYIPTDERES